MPMSLGTSPAKPDLPALFACDLPCKCWMNETSPEQSTRHAAQRKTSSWNDFLLLGLVGRLLP
eukprot:CAMPEP_0114278456 /NCGR_PEP_ID=MMETSP0059-20121206/1349_1 /TAXON_ID=36894 /ORGANISM="Pyramimonas parkeae, Strain CCMP726" /LENGTH=62 /DNA_ID=CAMNT_0001398661 /DNA_START=154 /DNA_END=339 /DNA_ORIENTATION=-